MEINQPSKQSRKRRHRGFNRWKSSRPISGNWFVLQVPQETEDLLKKEILVKDRIRQLFDRYGILFRDILATELPLFKWSKLFKTLRIMELSGEILSGYFFKDIQGIQFISHQAFRKLNASPLSENAIYWMNATDPVSMCGVGLEALKKQLPARRITTHIVYHGTSVVLISKKKGKKLHFLCSPDAKDIQDYLSFLKVLITREFNPYPRILVEEVNEKPVHESNYQDVLRAFGFVESHNGFVLMLGIGRGSSN